MATWTDIPDSVLEPGKPIRSVDALALRDNPIAIAEGHPDAPKVEMFEQLFTASGTFVAPKDGRYWVEMVGGGGRGGALAAGSNHAGGGGAGYMRRTMVTLIGGQSYPVVLGVNGSATTFAGLSVASGSNVGASQIGGTGFFSGSPGSSGGHGARGHYVQFNGGAMPRAGNGGGGGGTGGTGFGAGGGGRAGTSGSAGSGAPGYVWIRW